MGNEANVDFLFLVSARGREGVVLFFRNLIVVDVCISNVPIYDDTCRLSTVFNDPADFGDDP